MNSSVTWGSRRERHYFNDQDPDSFHSATPPETCPDINSLVDSCRQGLRTAHRVGDALSAAGLTVAASDVEHLGDLFDGLVAELERLRSANAALRELLNAATAGWSQSKEREHP